MTFYRCSDNYDFHCYIHMAVVAVLFMARAANDPSVFTITEKAPTRDWSLLTFKTLLKQYAKQVEPPKWVVDYKNKRFIIDYEF